MLKPELWIGPAQFTVGVVRQDDELHAESDEQAWGMYDERRYSIHVADKSLREMRDSAIHEILHAIIYEARLQSHIAGKSKEDKTKHEEDLVWVLARELMHCFERSRWRHKGKELLPRFGGGK